MFSRAKVRKALACDLPNATGWKRVQVIRSRNSEENKKNTSNRQFGERSSLVYTGE